MDEKLIAKLRRDHQLAKLPDGREGVPITIQFKGAVPALSRPERKLWLSQHFEELGKKLAHLALRVDADSMSLSGQTVDAVCAADQVDDVRTAVESKGHQVDIARTIQAAGD